MSNFETVVAGPARGEVAVTVVDCDIHLTPRTPADVLEYAEEPWRSRLSRGVLSGRETYLPYWDGRRLDSYAGAGPAGSDPDLVHEQLFEDASIDFGLVLPGTRMSVDPDRNAALCRAINTWLSETWLGKWSGGGRLYGSITVPVNSPGDAVREIEHWAGHPAFKQVLIGHHSLRPLGSPDYEPIWQAAARHGLPVAMHFSADADQALGATPVGHFERYVDYHAISTPLAYAAHLVSWICSGVFDRNPELRIVLVEGGFLWYRPLVARLASRWGSLGSETRAGRSNPLDYVLEHVRFTTQPVEEADSARDVARLMELADAERVLMFSSDYPHYDFDDPAHSLPRALSDAARARIMCDNARELYDLPAVRPDGAA